MRLITFCLVLFTYSQPVTKMFVNQPKFGIPKIFKGIALFTPGGDLIYGIDPSKQVHWHLYLCLGLQEILSLPEPPHFLVPGYTATLDRFFHSSHQRITTLAEIYPAVQRYQLLLNMVFATPGLTWQVAPWQEEVCNPMILETYRSQFPQLWENHDLVVEWKSPGETSNLGKMRSLPTPLDRIPMSEDSLTTGYVLRLFVSGNSRVTENTLETIHELLEQGLGCPYTLKVIDISKHPEQAEIHQVSATPTLVRVLPHPVRRIVGDLGDPERVLQILV